ncbi:retrotransposon protein, putative, ty1-copia subclass [Tanacetum coccineum]
MNKSCTTWKRPYLKRLLPLQLLLFATPTGPPETNKKLALSYAGCMTPRCPNELEDRPAFEILQELKTMFQQQAEQELFETVKAFHACKQEEGQFVSTYVLKMKAYLDQIERLGYPMPLVLEGIPKKTHAVLAIRQGQIQKPKSQARGKGKQRGKGKSKLAYDPKYKIPPPAKKEHPAKDTECHHCHKTGHWKRNCPLYLAELKKNKARYRKLNKGALDLYVGNGNTAAVEAIGSFDLILPSGMILVLDNFSKDNICYFNAFPRDGIFKIDMHNHISNERSIYTCSNKKTKHNLDSTFLWHCRLGHINKKCIEKLQHDGLLKSIDDESFDVCVSCISGKMARKPFTHASESADDLLGIIHSDVYGPFRTTSREGANYYVTFTDDFSRYGYVYLIKHKHEVFEMFKTFQNEVENQLRKTIKALQSDRGGEYLSQEFLDHLRSRGIISQLTPPYTPQHNGVSERRNRTLLDMVRSMMSLTTLPMSFWGYALESAARIINTVSIKKVNKTPYEMWHGKVPNLSYLKVQGCEALVKRDTPNKLESRSIKCIFVGYLKETTGYYFYYPLENKIFVACEDAQPSENTSLHQHEEHELGYHGEPPNSQAALSDHESEKWLEVMNAKMQSMKDNQVWNLVDLPPNCKTVGSIWLFKKKTDMDGNIHTYKARLVVKGFTQTYGVDFEETFSPVADIKAIRILIAIAAYYDYKIWQMDVKTAFLNGRLNEHIYMVQPEGFVNPKHPRRVCKLQRTIYGLKQASRIWNKRFDEEIKKYGFTQNLDEPCIYKRASGSIIVFLILYVDDISLMGNNILMLQDVKSWLENVLP